MKIIRKRRRREPSLKKLRHVQRQRKKRRQPNLKPVPMLKLSNYTKTLPSNLITL
jgi:hypothetical protein